MRILHRIAMSAAALACLPAPAAAQAPCTWDAQRVVNELYRNVLERQPDDGSRHWVNALESGQMTVREVVEGLVSSPEHLRSLVGADGRQDVSDEQAVTRIYRHLLGREPDPSGLRTYTALAGREGRPAVIRDILESPEYRQRFAESGVPGTDGLFYCGPRVVLPSPAQLERLGAPNRVAEPRGPGPRTLEVRGATAWAATGVFLRAGDLVQLEASGRIQISSDPGDVADPAGAFRTPRSGTAPLPDRAAGALVGRIGEGRPFLVGESVRLRAPASGELYLGINDDYLADNTGWFTVTLDAP